MDLQGIDVDAAVGQQSVHLLDRVLGQSAARQRQTLADQADRQLAAQTAVSKCWYVLDVKLCD